MNFMEPKFALLSVVCLLFCLSSEPTCVAGRKGDGLPPIGIFSKKSGSKAQSARKPENGKKTEQNVVKLEDFDAFVVGSFEVTRKGQRQVKYKVRISDNMIINFSLPETAYIQAPNGFTPTHYKHVFFLENGGCNYVIHKVGEVSIALPSWDKAHCDLTAFLRASDTNEMAKSKFISVLAVENRIVTYINKTPSANKSSAVIQGQNVSQEKLAQPFREQCGASGAITVLPISSDQAAQLLIDKEKGLDAYAASCEARPSFNVQGDIMLG